MIKREVILFYHIMITVYVMGNAQNLLRPSLTLDFSTLDIYFIEMYTFTQLCIFHKHGFFYLVTKN